jgi:putative phosphoribosyl transferase
VGAPRFADRAAAGRVLAARLAVSPLDHPLVAGLPRGGVVVAARVAEALRAPLAAVVARKVRCPGQPELAMGAVAVWEEHAAEVRVEDVLRRAGLDASEFRAAAGVELAAARHRSAELGGSVPVAGRTVIVVDDGLATGATMRAALAVLTAAGAGRLIAAIPVAPPEELATIPAEVVCLHAPDPFGAVGAHYQDFTQVEEATVRDELAAARGRQQ